MVVWLILECKVPDIIASWATRSRLGWLSPLHQMKPAEERHVQRSGSIGTSGNPLVLSKSNAIFCFHFVAERPPCTKNSSMGLKMKFAQISCQWLQAVWILLYFFRSNGLSKYALWLGPLVPQLLMYFHVLPHNPVPRLRSRWVVWCSVCSLFPPSLCLRFPCLCTFHSFFACLL